MAPNSAQQTVTVALTATIAFRDPLDGEFKRLGPAPSVELPVSTARALGMLDLSDRPLDRHRPKAQTEEESPSPRRARSDAPPARAARAAEPPADTP